MNDLLHFLWLTFSDGSLNLQHQRSRPNPVGGVFACRGELLIENERPLRTVEIHYLHLAARAA